MGERGTGEAWKWVARSMGLAAAYDAAFAVAILVFSGPASALMGLAVPADPIYFRMNGIFLVLLAALYVLPARDPIRYRGVVVVAAVGRLLGFAFLTGSWVLGAPTAFLWLGYADLAFAAAHALLLHEAEAGAGAAPARAAGPEDRNPRVRASRHG